MNARQYSLLAFLAYRKAAEWFNSSEHLQSDSLSKGDLSIAKVPYTPESQIIGT